MSKRSILAMLLVSTGVSWASVAIARLARTAAPSRVTFSAVGPAGFAQQGTTPDLRVDDDGTTVTITVPLANLDTGIGLRNRHMREKYLEVPKYPNAVLTVRRAALVFPKGDVSEHDAPGQLTVHGVTRPVTFHYNARGDSGAIEVSGRIHVNMNQHGIETPGYLGVTVKPDVDVAATFSVSD